ncbi:MAG: hypothetical protein RIB98_17360 [Acidimicrobiales bacterium]
METSPIDPIRDETRVLLDDMFEGVVASHSAMNSKESEGHLMAPRKEMTESHKAALAEGRAQGRAVRGYLEALEAHRPKRGRKRTPESMRARLAKIEASLDEADPMTRLQLVQERLDLTEAIASAETTVDLSALEDGFVDAAKGYGERKGISYAAWREVGVPAAILKRAGISRAG